MTSLPDKPQFVVSQGVRLLLDTDQPQRFLRAEYFRAGRGVGPSVSEADLGTWAPLARADVVAGHDHTGRGGSPGSVGDMRSAVTAGSETLATARLGAPISVSTFARDSGAGCRRPSPHSAIVLVRDGLSGRSDWPMGRMLCAWSGSCIGTHCV